MEIHPIPNHKTLPDMPSATNDDHDGRYYTEDEIDTIISDGTIDHGNLSGLSHTADHPYALLIDGTRDGASGQKFGNITISNASIVDSSTIINSQHMVLTGVNQTINGNDAIDIFNITGGVGGNGTGVNNGGQGSDSIETMGAGGASAGAVGGKGGSKTITAGNAGTSFSSQTADGGDINLNPGFGNSNGVQGKVYINGTAPNVISIDGGKGSNVPTIHAAGDNLTITASGGTIDFDNEILTTTGNINAATFNASNNASIIQIDTDTLLHIDGTRNVFLGTNAGNPGVISGTDNVGIGDSALRRITSGSNNFGLGQNAAGFTTTGEDCVGIGTGAIAGNIAGRELIGIGRNAFVTANTSRGVAIGDYAGTTLASGLYVTLVGSRSNVRAAATEKATAIGGRATAGSNGISIGFRSGYYETGDDKLYIDAYDRTNEATARLESLLYGTFSSTATSQTLTLNASVYIKEGPTGANTDKAGYGQMYCRNNAGTTELWFVNDAGTETQLA